MPDAPTLRRATDADSPAIRHFVINRLAEFSLPFEGDAHDADLHAVATAYADGLFLVVTEGSTILGSGGILPIDPDTMQLRKMFLDPRLRGRGLGRRILNELLDHARARPPIRRVTLETFHAMTAARRLYESCGFREVECRTPGPRCDMNYALELR